jgi:hypothetical protein
MTSLSTNKTIIIIGVLGVAALIYYLVSSKNKAEIDKKAAEQKTKEIEKEQKVIVKEVPSLYPTYVATDIYSVNSRRNSGHRGGGVRHHHRP